MKRVALLVFFLASLGGLGYFFAQTGTYGLHVLLRRGGTFWVTVRPDDHRISDSMRLALGKPPPAAAAGFFAWRKLASGFEVAELPVIANGAEVHRLLLSRIDPNRYRFEVRNAPAGNLGINDWMSKLGAVLVINGSYYALNGLPDTPLLSNGLALGPQHYAGAQGAFTASAVQVNLHDLAGQSWQTAFVGADNALVSYPLLVGPRPVDFRPSDWLANRSFVAEDGAGRIIFGTTENAFFSLARLASFLRAAPLGLAMALNLDGGPVACQAVLLANYHRQFCGKWELQDRAGTLKMLTWPFGSWALPVVVAVLPK